MTLFIVVITSCEMQQADDVESFPTADYSALVKSDKYEIESSTDALTVFNLFYNTFGYGEFNVSGSATHSESASLIGVSHSETITCTINKAKVYHINKSTTGSTISSFYVDIYNENDERLSYCYEWQYKNTNAWKNKKTSEYYKTLAWYNNTDEKTRTDWNIIINR